MLRYVELYPVKCVYDEGEGGALIIPRAQNHASQINVNKRVSFYARRILSCSK